MSRFKSMNYILVTCEGCGTVTSIEPGAEFGGLDCTCNTKVKLNDTEISKPVQQEVDYIKTQTVIVIGRFKDGDYEVCNGNNLDDTWRVPKATFESTYDEVKTYETPETTTNSQEGEISEGGDPLAITLSLEAFEGMTPEDIAATYNMDELRTLAKSLKIKGFSNMKEEKLIGKLLAKVD